MGEDNEAYATALGMPAWYTANIRLTYQFNKFVSFQAACENIFDQNYRQFASNISAPGRNFILTLRGSF
jgi:hemoglobin/transferrin/lactoferrin receptor protein